MSGTGEGSDDVRHGHLDRLEQQLARLTRRARRVVAERATMVHPDLQPAAYLMLALLLDRGCLRPSEVVEFFDIDKGSISRQVHQLVELGLVEKSRDLEDGRALMLTLTDAGRRGMAQVARTRRARYSERLGDWSDEDLEALVGLLTRYNASLDRPGPD